ncbi:unnamed protein product [Prunus armeniaca]
MKGEIEVREASNELLVAFSTSVPNATVEIHRNMERSLVVHYRTFTCEQKQSDAPTEGNNVGTECVMDYSDQFTTYSKRRRNIGIVCDILSLSSVNFKKLLNTHMTIG